MTERLKSNLAGTVVVTRGILRIPALIIIANTEKEYEILAIGHHQSGFRHLSVYICKPVYSPEGIRQLRGILKRSAMFEETSCRRLSLGHIYIRTEAEFKDQIIDEAVDIWQRKDWSGRNSFSASINGNDTWLSRDCHSHGDPGLVTKPVISVTKLDKPVLWDGVNTVDVIFVAGHSGDSRKYFEQLSDYF